jgi:hypothetical protein
MSLQVVHFNLPQVLIHFNGIVILVLITVFFIISTSIGCLCYVQNMNPILRRHCVLGLSPIFLTLILVMELLIFLFKFLFLFLHLFLELLFKNIHDERDNPFRPCQCHSLLHLLILRLTKRYTILCLSPSSF